MRAPEMWLPAENGWLRRSHRHARPPRRQARPSSVRVGDVQAHGRRSERRGDREVPTRSDCRAGGGEREAPSAATTAPAAAGAARRAAEPVRPAGREATEATDRRRSGIYFRAAPSFFPPQGDPKMKYYPDGPPPPRTFTLNSQRVLRSRLHPARAAMDPERLAAEGAADLGFAGDCGDVEKSDTRKSKSLTRDTQL